MKHETVKLDQLTSLRFFAALMIVILHCKNHFGIHLGDYTLDQGVSFFFVLSGFILTYVYSGLNTWSDIKLFWKARIARIWPGYIAAFLIGWWLVSFSYKWDYKTLVANMLFVQAWIPIRDYYFSYNPVAWSISTEFFFYLVFPVLIYRKFKLWPLKILIPAGILVALIYVSNRMAFQEGTSHVDIAGLLYVSPLARLPEFVLGVFLAMAWKGGRRLESYWVATACEGAALILCTLNVYYMAPLIRLSSMAKGSGGSVWAVHCGSLFSFGLLIYIMANGRGAISGLLKHPAFVFLGEISFSMYLLHYNFIVYYIHNENRFSQVPGWMGFSIYLAIVLICSYVIWACIEVPGRRLILKGWKEWDWILDEKARMERLFEMKKPLFFGVVLCALAISLNQVMDTPCMISTQVADELTPASLKSYSGAKFGKKYALRGLDVERKPDGLHLKLAWESAANQRLDFINAVHLLDSKNELIRTADYVQSSKQKKVKKGDVWLDTVFIPSETIAPTVKSVGIALYQGSKTPLAIDRGKRDWSDRRMVIPIVPEN